MGREIFSCECEVSPSAGSSPANPGSVDLVSCFPDGWQFPPILPPLAQAASVAATRLRNQQLSHLPEQGLLVGMADGQAIRLPMESRDRHSFLLGATGTGKSTLLLRMILADIARGEGVVLIDPHGDLYRSVLEAVPPQRWNDLFILDPTSAAIQPGLNILDIQKGPMFRRRVDFLIGELLRFFEEVWDMRNVGGPVFEMYFRNTMLLMCLQGAGCPFGPLSIRDFSTVMSDAFCRKVLLSNCPDLGVVNFWNEIAARTSGDSALANIVPYIASKMNTLAQGGFVTQLLGAPRNDFKLGAQDGPSGNHAVQLEQRPARNH